MIVFHSVLQGFSQIRANKLRSALSMMGVAVGVGSLVALVSVGEGVRAELERMIELSGGERAVMIDPATREYEGGRAFRVEDPVVFTPSDLDSLRAAIPDLERASMSSRRSVVVVRGADTTRAAGFEATLDHPMFVYFLPIAGVGLSPRDTLGVLVGSSVARAVSASVGDTLLVDGALCVVRGFLPPGMLGRAMLRNMREPLPGEDVPPRTILLVASSRGRVDETADTALAVLSRIHGEGKFEVASLHDQLAEIERGITLVTLYLGFVGFVSLFVGGIGVMNIMLASVAERTREIGIRRAAGARRRDMIFQVLAETSVLTFAGGVAGVLLGAVVGFGAAWLFARTADAPVPFFVSWRAVTAGMVCALVVGLAAGLLPARRAARLNPVDALRYE